MNTFTEWPGGSTGENLEGKHKGLAFVPSVLLAEYHEPQATKEGPPNHGALAKVQGRCAQPSCTEVRVLRGRSCTYHAHLTPFCRRLWHCLLCYCCKWRCWFKTTQCLPGATCHRSCLSSELPEGVTPGDKALHQVSLQCPQAAGPLASEWVTSCPASHRLFLLWPVSQTLWGRPSSWQPVGILVFSFAHQRTPAQVFALFS